MLPVKLKFLHIEEFSTATTISSPVVFPCRTKLIRLIFVCSTAQDRIGGRIHSVEVEKGWIELGAQYLHGDQSKLAEYCRDNDLLSHFFGTDGEGLYLRDNGCSISSGTVMACDVNDAIHDALHSSEQFYKNNETDYYVVGGESVGEYVRKIFDKYLSECNDPPPIRKMKEEIFDFKMRYLQVDNSCDSMYDLSVKMWGKYEVNLLKSSITNDTLKS